MNERSRVPWSKTLFVSSGLKAAMLVSPARTGHSQRRRMRSQELTFETAHAALDWCEANGAMMVFTPSTGRTGHN